MSWRSECHTEQYLSLRQLNGALDGVRRHITRQREVQREAHEMPRRLVAALGDDPGFERFADRGVP